MLEKKEFTDSNLELEKFKEYFDKEIIKLLSDKSYCEEMKNYRENFSKDYPLEKFLSMSLKEYAYDANSTNKNSFCYDITMGKYPGAIPLRSGDQGSKYGIYMHSGKRTYCGKDNEPVKDPENLWKKIRNEIYNFIKDVENDRFDNLTEENYPLIYTGMNSTLAKISCLYFPDKLFAIGSPDKLKSIYNLFGLNYEETCSTTLSHNLYKFVMEKIPELRKYDSFYVSNILFNYITMLQNTNKTKEKKKTKESNSNDSYVIEEQSNTLYSEVKGKNIIYYGGPGCGKSRLVKNLYCKDEESYIRTTFYPDYTNSDFIGQLIPIYEDEKLKYKIEPGPFTRALKKALKYENKKIYLIIEEINRGNASAIFGDIFQLLDRDDSGKSEYKISNYIIEKYISEELKINIEDNIYLPSNLYIIATMNTSDQNVFTLDSAFKRRWEMEYVSNKFRDKIEFEDFKEYDKELGSMFIPVKGTKITWKEFVDKINIAIVSINSFGINSEDKQIGKYFVSKDYLVTNSEDIDPKLTKKFGEKVLSYIWEDVAKTGREEWFKYTNTLQELLDVFVREDGGISVFSDGVIRILNGDSSETGE